jgi:mycothiol synthase
VAAFANDETEALIGARVVPPQWLLSHWTAPSVDRENDIAVVEASDGVLCGYLSVQANPPYASVFSLGMVALPYHGRGIGAALVAENERRAQRFFNLADTSLRLAMQAGALADEPLVSNLLAGHGYGEVRRHELRRIDFVGEPEPPAVPVGIEVRTMRPSDSEQVFAAHREAFADHWGEDEETYEDFRHRLLAALEFDADLWFLAWEGDELAGYIGAEARAAEDPQRGYVPVLGVRRAYRRRGVGGRSCGTSSGRSSFAGSAAATSTSTPNRSPAPPASTNASAWRRIPASRSGRRKFGPAERRGRQLRRKGREVGRTATG